MTETAPPLLIKKYSTRRLYNTATSAYITLEDVAAMAKTGSEFVVQDAKTGEDITRLILMQIIVEQEKTLQSLLPISFLRELIAFYGDGMQIFVRRYLEMSLELLTRQRESFRPEDSATNSHPDRKVKGDDA